ncbi:MAG TPA: hypothetical protein VGI39_08605 [Polyangiaceae bacterium]|jgi:hypothetical protein
MHHGFRFARASAALLAVAACNVGSSDVPLSVDLACTNATVGAAGGTLTHETGAVLTIPAGALSADVALTWCGAPPPDASALGGATALAQAYVAGPAGTTFAMPVAVAIPFDPTRLASSTSASSVKVYVGAQGAATFAAVTTSATSTTTSAGGLAQASVSQAGEFVAAGKP